MKKVINALFLALELSSFTATTTLVSKDKKAKEV